jgi:hypothetical protein
MLFNHRLAPANVTKLSSYATAVIHARVATSYNIGNNNITFNVSLTSVIKAGLTIAKKQLGLLPSLNLSIT